MPLLQGGAGGRQVVGEPSFHYSTASAQAASAKEKKAMEREKEELTAVLGPALPKLISKVIVPITVVV